MNFVYSLNNQSSKPDESCSMPTLSQRLECMVSQITPGKVSKYSITLTVKALVYRLHALAILVLRHWKLAFKIHLVCHLYHLVLIYFALSDFMDTEISLTDNSADIPRNIFRIVCFKTV